MLAKLAGKFFKLLKLTDLIEKRYFVYNFACFMQILYTLKCLNHEYEEHVHVTISQNGKYE